MFWNTELAEIQRGSNWGYFLSFYKNEIGCLIAKKYVRNPVQEFKCPLKFLLRMCLIERFGANNTAF